MILSSTLLENKKKQCKACCNNQIPVLTKNFLQCTTRCLFCTPEPSQKLFTNDQSLSSFRLKEPLRNGHVNNEFNNEFSRKKNY